MKWRKWFRIIHRDVGYIGFGLTMIYAISGVAVNHVADWNPNYKIKQVFSNIGPLNNINITEKTAISDLLEKAGESKEYNSIHLPDPETLQIFKDDKTISINLETGDVISEEIRTRPLLKAMNFLHLNTPKKIWTVVADLFAVALAVLAITGLFLIKGEKGITGRGAWLTGLGIVLPIIFLLFYY